MLKKKRYKIHHYRNNWVIFSLIFVSVGLMTSGLAAFVVSQTKKSQQQGKVDIGVVNDINVHFSDLKFVRGKDELLDTDNITFDADPNDKDGRIQHDGVGSENLTFTLEGKVGPTQYINACTYQLIIPQSVKDAIDAGYVQVYRPNNAKYEASKDYTLSPQPINYAQTSGDASFSLTVGFNWGVFFNYDNPSLYYDDKSEKGGASISDAEVINQRKQFRKVMYYGKDYTGEVDSANLPELKFTISLMAKTALA